MLRQHADEALGDGCGWISGLNRTASSPSCGLIADSQRLAPKPPCGPRAARCCPSPSALMARPGLALCKANPAVTRVPVGGGNSDL